MKRMLRWLLSHPFISTLTFWCWILLNELTLPHAIVALVLAIMIPKLVDTFWVPQPHIHKPFKLMAYMLMVAWDIMISNLQVAKAVLSLRHEPRPGFIIYPLAMQEPFPITLLTSTISLSPGTLSAHLRLHDNTLLIHALNIGDDREAFIQSLYERYERPLKEIFGC